MHIYIKNMVCNRCILVVRQVLERLDIETRSIILGEVETKDEISTETLRRLTHELETLGFEILDNHKQQVIEKIKNVIVNHVHHSNEHTILKFSQLLSKSIHKDYSYLSSLFSEEEGITIGRYIINQKIEKVKELLVYDELTLSEIAFKLGYSSVAHLSNQFKKVTGLTPTYFREVGQSKRKPIDKV